MPLSMKRIAPGHNNTWFIRVQGMEGSVEFSTKNPKELRTMRYHAGGLHLVRKSYRAQRLISRLPARHHKRQRILIGYLPQPWNHTKRVKPSDWNKE
ncbi:hypothetical protein AN963_07785 [Brevibacillus choshinensis]|uniref:Transposase n=1 Tax=Brevibacillus choshinensis TaxID=54911 RepID=A0ABR5NDM3_BRECH|nr:hypothetical protein AN963_07785 [Brevibacillus choshinensis]